MKRFLRLALAMVALASCNSTQTAVISADLVKAQAVATTVKADADEAARVGLPALCSLLGVANVAFSLSVVSGPDATTEQAVYRALVGPGAPCEPGVSITNAVQAIPSVLYAVRQIQAAVKG